MALNAGDVLLNGQYRILREIGQGGFGYVYSAWENLTGETVAIKELIPGLVGDPSAVQRFIQEARATQRLTHPNIVRTHNIFQDRGNYYLVMEYLPGGSLADRLEQGRMPVSEALRIMESLCSALSYAHEQGVVHLDLKPANILFDADDSVKLADFGIAHVSGQMMTRRFLTAAGVAFGTIGYMAPEQLEGVRDDPRLDVYALGTLLYEMLAGRSYLDFEDETTPAAQMRNMQRIQNDAPRPLRAVNSAVPAWLAQVVERALRKEPSQRYDTVSQLASMLASKGVGPSPIPAPPPPIPSRRWSWPVVGGAIALLLAVALVTAAVIRGGQEPTPTPRPTGTVVARTPVVPTPAPSEHLTPAWTPSDVPTVRPSPTPTSPISTPILLTSTSEPTATQIIGPYIGQTVTVRVPVADIWPNPRASGGSQKRETQVLMGEQVEITEIREGWYGVVVLAQPSSKDPRGYPGWIQVSQVTLRPYELDRIIIVMSPSAYLLASPGSSVVAEISLDTRLRIVQEETGWLQVELPDGDRAWIDASQVRVEEVGASTYVPSPEDLVRTARSLLGIRYLWGGSSWKALDCSGVVYRTFHAHGIQLARDSRDQAQGGRVVAREDLQPGDLVFYAVGGPSGTVSHVGLYVGAGMAIATYDGQDVMIRPYDDPTYAKEFWGARRYWRE